MAGTVPARRASRLATGVLAVLLVGFIAASGGDARAAGNPAIEIEKYATALGAAAGDADTAPGVTMDPFAATSLTFRVTNVGDEPLVGVTVTDALTTGTGAVFSLTCDANGDNAPDGLGPFFTAAAPFGVGASFTCTGSIPSQGLAATHGDLATVTAADTVGSPVQDTDAFHGFTPGSPSIDVESFATAAGPAGGDADDPPGLLVDPAAAIPLTFTVTNGGDEALVNVGVYEATTVGTATIADLTCDVNGDGLGDGTEHFFTFTQPFPAGESFTCTGTVPALGPNGTYADEVFAIGVGRISNEVVTDIDTFNATAAAAVPLLPGGAHGALAVAGIALAWMLGRHVPRRRAVVSAR